MIENHIKDHLDAFVVKAPDHLLELEHLGDALAHTGIRRFGSEEA